jgi:diacylglycerol kinase (ATP)
MKHKVYIVANPVAGAGKAEAVIERLPSLLQGGIGAEYRLLTTDSKGAGIELGRRAVEQGAGLIIIVGGDGTINEVVNGILSSEKFQHKGCDLGIINCGSGGGLAQSLGIPHSLEEQVDTLLNASAKPLDVGKLRFVNPDGAPAERFFVSECQAGIGGAVVTKVGAAHKQMGGLLAFASAAVAQLFHYKSKHIRVRMGDGRELSNAMLGVVVGNGRYCAGGMQLTPAARPDDGFLDVLTIGDMRLPRRLSAFSKVYSGKHIYLRDFSLTQTDAVSVESEEPLWLEADGELMGLSASYQISVCPGAIRIRY